MKYLTIAMLLCIWMPSKAQVGIGTNTPSAELEIAASSTGLPSLELNPQTSPIGNASGQISVIGDQLYLFDSTRGKWLSVGSSTFNFGGEGSQNNENLEYAGDIDNNGPKMPQDGTIVYVTLNSSGGNLTKGITLNVHNDLNVLSSTHSMNLVDGKLIMPNSNFDFSSGDYFTVSVADDPGNAADDVSMVIWTKWRK